MYRIVQLRRVQQLIKQIESYLGKQGSLSWDAHLRMQRDVARPQARPTRRVVREIRTHS